MERNFNVDRRFRLFADKLTSNHASKDLIIESSYNTIELSSNAVIFDGIVDLSIVTCNNINISNISEIVTKFLRVKTLTLPSNVVISYNSVNDGYIINTRVGYNLQGIGRSDAYFTYINVSGGDSSFNDSLYINKNLLVDGTLTINNDLLINGKNFEIIENSFNNYKASLEQNFYSTKITTKDLSALNISISNELVVNKTAFINDLTLSGQLLNNVLRVPNIFTIDPSGFDNHSGTLFINGDLTVLGAITTLSSSNIDICDVAITLASKLANRLDLINANAGLDISNIASLKYNGTSWDFSGGQLTLDNKKILFDVSLIAAASAIDLSFNALNADFSSSFFILKRNIDNSFNNTYNRSQIDSSFILRSKVDISLIYLNTYVDNSYVSKNQFTNSFQDIITLMDVSYVAKNSVITGQPQYDYSTSTISQFGQDIFGEETNTYSGYNVSLSEDGTIIGITAPYNNGTGTLQGSARIYKYNDVSWVQLGQDIDGEANNDEQAIIKLSKDGTIAALGSWNNSGIGSIRVFKYNDISWIQQGQDIDGTAADDEFGRSISLSANGKIIAIGATHNDTSYYSAGQVLVYSYNDVSWNIIGTFNGFYEEAYTGFSVSLSSSGTILAISTLPSEGSLETLIPRVDIYELSNNAWTTKGHTIYSPYASNNGGSRFGRIIELSSDGTIVAINDRFLQDTNYGRVLVYKYTSSDNSWNRLGSDISGSVPVVSYGDLDPYIALSADGTIMAVGYISDSDFKGLVRLYKFINNNWIQIGTTDLSGDNVQDNFGYSLALSSNGSILAIGSIFNPPDNIGRVRTYNVNYAYTVTNPFDISFASFNTKVDLSYVLKTVFEASHNSLKNRFEISFNTIKTSNFDASSITIDTINTRHNTQKFANSLWNQIGLDISNNIPLNNKKVAISNDGKVAAMSSSTFDLSNARDVGIVYVYELSYNEISYNWIRLGNNAIVGISGDELGYSLALSSNGRIVAASSLYNDNSGNNSGLVRVFELSNNLWINRGNIISGRNITNYQSGYSLNLSGNGNIISISSLKGTTDLSYGEVRVYELSSNNIWIKKGRDISGTISGASEGYSSSLSLDGSTLALGSSYRPQDRLISQFVRLGQIIEPNGTGGDFGYSVSLNDAGTIVAIGLPYNTVNGIAQVGSVIVYELNSYGLWIQRGQTLNGANIEQFGWSVSLNGDGTRLAVGAPGYPNGSTLGGVKVYSFSGTTWTSLGGVIVGVYGTGTGEGCLAGRSVSLNSAGTIVAFGEPNTDNYNVGSGSGSVGQGRARVFQYNGSAWVQYGNNITALNTAFPNTYNQQGLGLSISLNSSGTRVAIGAAIGDSNGAIAMYAPGHVLVFDLISGTWTQVGQKIAGNSRDELGSSCSLNATGNIVACGGRKSYPDGTGIGYGGVVRVYIQSGSTWILRGTAIYGEANYDYAGTSVSLNDAGNILAIGAPNNDGNGADIGHVRVYQYIDASSNWYQMGVDIDGCLSVSIPNRTQIAGLNLDIGSQTNANYFGRSVSLNAAGTRLAIGGASGKGYGVVTEFKAYSGTIPNIGQVNIFRFTNDWNSIGTIQGPQIYLVDTAYNINATLIPSQGQILGEPFTLSGTTYSNTDGNGYGSALNSDGTIFAISSASTPSLGCVRVYKFNGISWQLMGPIIYGTSTNYIYVYYNLGLLISYDGRTVATIVAGSTTTFAIYKYNDISWNRIGLLTNNRAAIYEANSLSGDGNTFAIANSTIQVVLVWKYINNVWTSIASIPNTSYGVAFPSAIALSYNGNTLVVSNRNWPNGDNQQGIAAILKYNDISWQQLGLSIIGPTPVQEFGMTQSSISSDGLTVLIGGYKEGRVFKYNAIDVSWQYLGAIPGQAFAHYYEQFVGRMSSDGTIVATWYSDKAFIWKYRLGSWVKIVEYSDGTGFNGQALSADGTVYATCHTTPTYIKIRKLTTIIETQYNENLLYASNKDNYLNLSFGKDIKLSSNGNKIVVGATGPIGVAYNENLYSFYNYNQGSIWTYEYAGTGTTWKQLGQSIHGISGGDEFGSSVSMSDDGTIISAGSNNYNSNRGYVRVFTYINNNWYQLDNILNGKTATSMAGINALSGDGRTLIQTNNIYNSVYGINKDLALISPTATISTTISGDLAIIGRTYLKSFKISNKFAFDTSGAGYSSNYLASTDISASIIDYYSNVGSTYNKVFKIDACGNISNYSGLYGTISDSRLKKNIVTSAPKLEDMLKIRVINYNLKGPDSTKYIGLLAQELEELFPELVFEDNTVERFKSVNYSSLTIMLIKAFQEQQVLINNLIATLEELEEEIENKKLINS